MTHQPEVWPTVLVSSAIMVSVVNLKAKELSWTTETKDKFVFNHTTFVHQLKKKPSLELGSKFVFNCFFISNYTN